ncbi:MAG: cytidylyltransferase domain-containing protein, partial [Flavobacteriales bacterium]
NIQGDEPFILPEQIDQVAELLINGADIATLVKPISDSITLLDPNKVKAVLDNKNRALYFSRSPIPFMKSKEVNEWVNLHQYYKHLGIYGYQKQVLRSITHLELSPLEQAESLEQLRWLQNGYEIVAGITKYESPSIDTPSDLEQAVQLLNSGQLG